jgi:hypothetical protein
MTSHTKSASSSVFRPGAVRTRHSFSKSSQAYLGISPLIRNVEDLLTTTRTRADGLCFQPGSGNPYPKDGTLFTVLFPNGKAAPSENLLPYLMAQAMLLQ